MDEKHQLPELRFESPLAGAVALNTSISIREMPERGMVDLRGHTSDRKFMAAAKKVLGVDIPKQPRGSVSWGDIKCLWLSIDQWLVLCPLEKADEITAALQTALKGVHSLVVNVSDMRAVIRLEGEGSREVVMKGTSTDLLDGTFQPGAVKRMRFAEIAALLHVVSDNVLDIYVFRSYAHYAWAFLEKSARKGSEVRLYQQPVTAA
jgi:sarcosine oxidase, subunit gamma